MLNKIKSVLKYYSDMLTSINYHTKEESEKSTKILEESKKSTKILEQLINEEKPFEYLQVENTYVSNKNICIINLVEDYELKTHLNVIKDKEINKEIIDFYDFFIINLSTQEKDFKNISYTNSYYPSATNIEERFLTNNKIVNLDVLGLFDKLEGFFLIQKKDFYTFYKNGEINFSSLLSLKIKRKKEYSNKVINKTNISIVIPLYNKRDYIGHLIDMLLEQREISQKDIEIIIVDDYSTDGSRETLKLYDNYHNFKIIYNEKNIGLGLTRRAGWKAAKFDWITFLDADDVISDELFIEYMKLIETYPKMDIGHIMLSNKIFDKKYLIVDETKYTSIYHTEKEKKNYIHDGAFYTKIYKKSILKDSYFLDTKYEDNITPFFMYDKNVIMHKFKGYFYVREGQDSILNNGGYLYPIKLIKDLVDNTVSIYKSYNESVSTDFMDEFLRKQYNRIDVMYKKSSAAYKPSFEKFILENFDILNEFFQLYFQRDFAKTDSSAWAKYFNIGISLSKSEFATYVLKVKENQVKFVNDKFYYYVSDEKKIECLDNKFYNLFEEKNRNFIRINLENKFNINGIQYQNEVVEMSFENTLNITIVEKEKLFEFNIKGV